MKFIADLHIHSHYSISTSKKLVPEHLDYWARLKGITVVGSGDFTHPGWLAELKDKLRDAEAGLFALKDEHRLTPQAEGAAPWGSGARFLLSAEISNIYQREGKVRKVHNLILVPDFQSAEAIQRKLAGIGNISSDGRPILGLDSRDLLELVLEASAEALFIPAHIWTPWFSALGAKSGFDSIEQCYGSLAEHIYAVETGLSSDPPMNWMCSFLDRYTLISNSDAHSPEKLGREANLLDTELSYPAISQGIKNGQAPHFLGTIEFFPQEGKYHYDGHRKCGIHWNPLETLGQRGICPACGKQVTIGVMNRVAQLADRDRLPEKKKRASFHSLIPLKEILSEILECGPQSKKINLAYHSLLRKAGPELPLLLDLPPEEIARAGGAVLGEAIRRMRNRKILIQEGFDGEYGRIKLFEEGEKGSLQPQELLFRDLIQESRASRPSRELIPFDLQAFRKLRHRSLAAEQDADWAATPGEVRPRPGSGAPSPTRKDHFLDQLNPEQLRAVRHYRGPALIIAGPGTGKTRTLTARVAYLILERGVNPGQILAVTFTNKAAGEIRERLTGLLGDRELSASLQVSTFHAFGLSLLRQREAPGAEEAGHNIGLNIIEEEEKLTLLGELSGKPKNQVKSFSRGITQAKQGVKTAEQISDPELRKIYRDYSRALAEQGLLDLDDLIYQPVKILQEQPDLLSRYRKKIQWILIDEYQDINLAQYRLIRLLAPDNEANLCAVGDPNQAIYAFRGADSRFINRFLEDYPEAAVFKLKTSYRCSELILQASSQVIQGSGQPSLLQGLARGVKLGIVENGTEKSEAELVARTIEEMMGGLRFFSMDSEISQGERARGIESLSAFAVLCRMGRQFPALEKAFRDHGIPYQRIGDDPFFKQEPVRSAIDLLRYAVNPGNRILARRLTEANRIAALEYIPPLGGPLERGTGSSKSVKGLLEELIDRHLQAERSAHPASFDQLLDLAGRFGHRWEEFFKLTLLGVGVDTYRPDTEAVALLTLHAAKGLEFQCVFIVGCEDGLLPYSLFKQQPVNSEEEQRLFYVGMTRAKNYLFLSRAGRRTLFGREYRLPPSPYLARIEREITEQKRQAFHKEQPDPQLKLF